ncbi:MAG: hypothetical protein D4R68_08285 [Ignavibacteriales bacterium]|nr:MAG: hypothetical protein D4R68_08285 [Ignavibacteriales bacterium]
MKDIIFWILIAYIGWLGIRHLFAIVVKYDAMGPLKSGQRLTHFVSALILLSSCLLTIIYNYFILLIVGFVIEYLFRHSIIRSGEKVRD